MPRAHAAISRRTRAGRRPSCLLLRRPFGLSARTWYVAFRQVSLGLMLMSGGAAAVRAAPSLAGAPQAAAALGPKAAEPTTQSPATHVVAGERNRALGIGEPREPQPFTLEQRLLEAVRQGDRAIVERALARGATLDATDDLGRSTVLLATKDTGDLAFVEWLLARGAAPDEPDVAGRTALSFAATAGRPDLVRVLLERGAALDRPDRARRTPLFHAALGNHTDVVALLANRGADVNVRDKFGDTPLIVACAKGHAATAALLLERGADPKATDQEGRTAAERSAPGVAPCQQPAPE